MSKLRKIMIVFEETGDEDGQGFNVYLAGDKERLDIIKQKDMSIAEFWSARSMNLVVTALAEAGVIRTIHRSTPPKSQGH